MQFAPLFPVRECLSVFVCCACARVCVFLRAYVLVRCAYCCMSTPRLFICLWHKISNILRNSFICVKIFPYRSHKFIRQSNSSSHKRNARWSCRYSNPSPHTRDKWTCCSRERRTSISRCSWATGPQLPRLSIYRLTRLAVACWSCLIVRLVRTVTCLPCIRYVCDASCTHTYIISVSYTLSRLRRLVL